MADTSKSPKHSDEPADPAASVDEADTESTSADAPVPAKKKLHAVVAGGLVGKLKHFGRAYWAKKKWTLPVSVIVLVALILAVPFTRYQVLGLFLKEDVSVAVTDSVSHKPVSSAVVAIAGVSTKTDGSGKAKVRVRVGNSTLTLSKQYYTDTSEKVLVSLSKSHNSFNVAIVATGRQVPIVVTNKITGKGVSGAVVKVLDTEAKTDTSGKAVIVLPTKSSTQSATISASGFNDLSAKIQITDQVVSANTFSITPSGKVYFLSKLSGTIDVVKTNLDGSDRQTVLGGTGNEDDAGTVLLASRDWKYLALLSVRTAGGKAELNLINTSTDQLSNIDKGDANFDLVGWDNDNFIYTVYRNSVQNWQPDQQSIKSFNAQNGNLLTLDNTDASGSNIYTEKYQTYDTGSIHFLGSTVLFSKNWHQYYSYLSAPGQQNSIYAISPDGSNKKTITSIDAGASWFGGIIQYKPNQLLVQTSSSQGGDAAYFTIDGNLNYATADDSSAAQDFSNPYPTYLLSPSGNQTFWSESRDGKNTLLVGDQNGDSAKSIATLSEYQQYGWYSDNYLLISKNGSELWIMPVSGGTPLKVSDYHKPVRSYFGYGGGYGGF